jgi:hypothetical protein
MQPGRSSLRFGTDQTSITVSDTHVPRILEVTHHPLPPDAPGVVKLLPHEGWVANRIASIQSVSTPGNLLDTLIPRFAMPDFSVLQQTGQLVIKLWLNMVGKELPPNYEIRFQVADPSQIKPIAGAYGVKTWYANNKPLSVGEMLLMLWDQRRNQSCHSDLEAHVATHIDYQVVNLATGVATPSSRTPSLQRPQEDLLLGQAKNLPTGKRQIFTNNKNSYPAKKRSR